MKITTIKTLTLLALITLAIPVSASAATVYVESSRNTISVGDTAIITVKINAEGAVLNTVEGDITLKSSPGNGTIQEFSLANSSFGLWPRTPSVSKDGRTVSFVGGVPGGFSIEGATLFKMIVQADKEGSFVITPQNISAYSSDGKGTKIPVTMKGFPITIVAKKAGIPAQNDWSAIVSQDTTPPGDFLIILGQENNLFEGKKFAFFSALDNQSGIDHYEVSENGGPAVRSGSTYVLQNQGDGVKLFVTAFDKAGNKKTATYNGSASGRNMWIGIVVVLLVLVIVIVLVMKSRKNKRNAPGLTY